MHTVGAGILDALADNGAALQIGAGADHGSFDMIYRAGAQHHLGYMAVFGADCHHFGLPQAQVLRSLQRVLHHLLVATAIRLGTQRPHRRPLAPVQKAVLDAGAVGRPRHFAAQRVQFAHQMPLACAADGGIAGHIAYGVQIDGEANGLQTQTRGSQSRLNTGVSGADDGNIKLSGIKLVHENSL